MMHGIAALSLGIMGSLHCLGMCGPLAIALPRPPGGRAQFFAGRLLYNFGRTITYAAMGAVFGALGATASLIGWQRILSVAAGLVLLLYALGYALGGRARLFDRMVLRAVAPVQAALARRLRRGSRGLLAIGLLNGLLPCGLVYVALAGAAATGSTMGGAAFMALFGLGTVPLMMAVSLAGPALQHRVRGRLQRVVPLALGALAVLFILRGLELGIPYVSPNLAAQVESNSTPACCAH